MGNVFSGRKIYIDSINSSKCFICSKQIKDKHFISCIRCKVKLHTDCELNIVNTKYYNVCPRCEKYGSLIYKITK